MALSEITEISVKDALAVDQLVSAAFQYQRPHHYFEDFPIWGTKEVLRLGVFDSGKLVSHVGVHFCEMQTQSGSEPVALIGAVATDSNYRGKGLSTALLKDAIKRIEAKNCTWSILWGSEHEFYGRLGFKLQGVQARALISDLAIDTEDLKASKVQTGLTDAIINDFLKRKNGIQFQDQDRTWLSKQKTVEWLYLDSPFAYVAYQRGMDLKHIVHEMGGDARGIQRILYHLYLKCSIAQVMGSVDELRRLGFRSDALFEESLCLARPTYAGVKWNPEFWISGLSAC